MGVVEGRDEGVERRDEGEEGRDEGVEGRDECVEGRDECVEERDEGVEGRDEYVMCVWRHESMTVVLSYVRSHSYIRKVFEHFFGCAKSAVLIFVFLK